MSPGPSEDGYTLRAGDGHLSDVPLLFPPSTWCLSAQAHLSLHPRLSLYINPEVLLSRPSREGLTCYIRGGRRDGRHTSPQATLPGPLAERACHLHCHPAFILLRPLVVMSLLTAGRLVSLEERKDQSHMFLGLVM